MVVLQPNIPNLVAWDREQIERELPAARWPIAEGACRPGAFVILPESALWP